MFCVEDPAERMPQENSAGGEHRAADGGAAIAAAMGGSCKRGLTPSFWETDLGQTRNN
jgi:hypothetical protein